jgi:membrane-associated phospholipid phosphatase
VPTVAKNTLFALALALLAGACIALAFLLDAPVEGWVAAHREPAWEAAAKMISRYGAWPWLMVGGITGIGIAWARRRPDWIRVLVTMMVAASIAGLSADCIRGVTGRTRPNAGVPQGWYGLRRNSEWLIGRHAYNAFPSGHTAAATAFAAAFWFSYRKRGMILALAALCVAGSRLYLAEHHFSDVVAGFWLGVGVAAWMHFRWMNKLLGRDNSSVSLPAETSA